MLQRQYGDHPAKRVFPVDLLGGGPGARVDSVKVDRLLLDVTSAESGDNFTISFTLADAMYLKEIIRNSIAEYPHMMEQT